MVDSERESECIERLDQVSAADWDALERDGNPFLSHDFLAGLERYDCLARHGWYPRHLVLRRQGRLLAALPLYQRDNSFGEFVFDWSWADAHERAIGPYYPKLVSAVPFTPVTGPRLLLHPQAGQPQQLRQLLLQRATALAERDGLSSLHVLFPDNDDPAFAASGLQLRRSCQYHWFNDSYADFDDFLTRLNSKRRKEIRRERRSVRDTGLQIEQLRGRDIEARHWNVFYDFYCSTFERKWGEPRLTPEFLHSLSGSTSSEPLLIMARDGGEYVAGALALIGEKSLYGRHWGCRSGYRNLHFELCYYQTIDFCIRHGLQHLDAGAQGEYKISRGFVPVATRSYHWLRDRHFSRAVTDFLERERPLVEDYIAELGRHTAYKRGDES